MRQRSIAVVASCLWLTLASCGDAHVADALLAVEPPPPRAAEPVEVAPSPPAIDGTLREPETVPARMPERPSELTKPAPGGQSGGEGVESCEIRELPLGAAVDRGKPVRDVWNELEKALTSQPPLRWRVRNAPLPPPATTLAISNVEFAETVKLGCASLDTMLQFDAESEDDQLAGHFAGKLTGTSGDGRALTIESEMVSGIFAGPSRGDIPDDAKMSLVFEWRDADPSVIAGLLKADMKDIGAVGDASLPIWTADPALTRDIVQSELQRTGCANLSATSLASFASEAALQQSVAQRWILCEGRTNQDFVGLEIDSIGHWRELKLVNGELVAAQGFGREGEVVRNIFGSAFNIALLDMLPERYTFFNAGLSADGKTLRLDGQPTLVVVNATLQVTDLPVREPTTTFQDGARAGQAACSAQPTKLTTRPSTVDAFRGRLAGKWTFCRGRLGTTHAGIRFETDGTFAFLAADGSDAVTGTFMVTDTSTQNGPGAYQADLTWTGGRTTLGLPMFSNTPVMMLAADQTDSLLSAM